MRRAMVIPLALIFLSLSFSAMAQRVRRNGQWWNPNYIMGDWDATNNRYNAIQVTSGVNGDNADGNPSVTANYSGVYGLGNLWDGGWYLDRRYVTGGGGSKYALFYQAGTVGEWHAGRKPSAADPVYLNYDLRAVYFVEDMAVWNYTFAGQPGVRLDWYYSGVKDCEVLYKVNAGDPWTSLGVKRFGYQPVVINDGYGRYRPDGLHNGPTEMFNGWKRPIPLGVEARYFQFRIMSNWGDGKSSSNPGEGNDTNDVGLQEVNFYKRGPFLSLGGQSLSIWKDEGTTMTWDFATGLVGYPLVRDLQIYNQGGYSIPENDALITSISIKGGPESNWSIAYEGEPIAPERFPIVIHGNSEAALKVIYSPKAYGIHEDSFTIHYRHEGSEQMYHFPITMKGKGVGPTYGYIPALEAKGSAGYPTFSDAPYLIGKGAQLPYTTIAEVPAFGWMQGTKLAYNYGDRGFLSEGAGVDKHWFKFDLGEEFGTATEKGALDAMWVWPARWFGGNPSVKNVKIFYSNDEAAWKKDVVVTPDSVPDHTGWTFLRDETFPVVAAPYRVQHKVDFSNVAGPFRYVEIFVNGPAGEGNYGNTNALSLGHVRFYQKGPSLIVSPDGYNFGELNVYRTSETQFYTGNVGDPDAGALSITAIKFSTDRGWNGGGFFSLPDVDDLGLPKVFAPGTTETFTVRYAPIDFGNHIARIIVESSDGARVNAWECEVKGKVVEYATGFIRGIKATANAQYDAGGWAAQAAVDSRGIQETDGLDWNVSSHIGSKQAKHWYGGNAWLMGATQRISEAWIECDLGGVYNLDEMWLWNASWNDMNQFYGPESAIKTTYIEYRQDAGDSWQQLGGDDMFYTFFGLGDRMWATNPYPATNLVDGDADQTNNPPVTFGGVRARYVRVSTAGGHDVGSWGDSIFAICVAEMRFYSKAGEVSVSPSILNYGSGAVDSQRTLTFDIQNESGSAVDINLVVPLGLDTPFVVTDPTGPIIVQPNSAYTVKVVFAPTEVGSYANFKIGVIGDLGVQYVVVNGTSFIAGTPDLLLDKQRLDFGTVYLPIDGSAPEPTVLPYKLSNLGDVALEVSSIVTSNTSFPTGSGNAFTIDRVAPFEVAADPSPYVAGMETVNVSFVPLVAGNYSGEVVMESNDPDESPSTVTLVGRALVTQPAAIDNRDWMLY